MNVRHFVQKFVVNAQRLISQRIILVLTLLFCLGATVTMSSVWQLSQNLIQSQALSNAELSVKDLKKARTLYNEQVVGRVQGVDGVTPAHNYETIIGGIPLPATFLIELGDRLSEEQQGILTRLYSDYPFPWREATGGARDEFETQALIELRKNPKQPFYRIENFKDRISMRYAEADVMTASCVACHNSHPDTPKRDWQVGDVRGVVEVVQPLDGLLGQTRQNITTLLILLMGLFAFGLSGLVLALKRLNNTSKILELRVVERTADLQQANKQLAHEQQKADNLLLNILPERIATKLKNGSEHIADGFGEVTILFADIVGFTKLSEAYSPKNLVNLLNEIFSAFDALSECYKLEKIKTIGDAYMVATGLPEPRTDHAVAIAEMALSMQRELARINQKNGIHITLRIGINSGPVVAGVIGTKKFIYDLWGDAVNTASRMESHGVPESIQVTEDTYKLLKDNYDFQARGSIEIKGKGAMNTYFLLGRKQSVALYETA
ncbi:MAG: adenylate/guanylate cyclase domain-containing protein [Limnothrix sp.]